MHLILPAEISGKIMSLIDQADEKLVIVSPYNKVSEWKKLKIRIADAQKRNVKIEWYIRKDVIGNKEQVLSLGIVPIEIANLHCKVYLNENQAVVTSMNLHEFSDTNSLDIGYQISDPIKYKEIQSFIETYIIKQHKQINMEIKTQDLCSTNTYIDLLKNFLCNYSKHYKLLDVRSDKKGSVIELQNFMKNYTLFFEHSGAALRIDLRIQFPYLEKKKEFYRLLSKYEWLEKKCGTPISFGNQMWRLKIDLQKFENLNHLEWTKSEFDILRPTFENVLNTYITELN